VDDHPVLGGARAGGNEHPGAFDLNHADPADVHRMEGFQEAEGRNLDTHLAAGREQRRSLRHAHLLTVDGQLNGALALTFSKRRARELNEGSGDSGHANVSSGLIVRR
jgi:hypothetical protein